jgi:hypothetical protein
MWLLTGFTQILETAPVHPPVELYTEYGVNVSQISLGEKYRRLIYYIFIMGLKHDLSKEFLFNFDRI